jgi:hypothetical protein
MRKLNHFVVSYGLWAFISFSGLFFCFVGLSFGILAYGLERIRGFV